MTSFKQTRLLSCIVFLYERSTYPFHSSVARRQRLTEGVSAQPQRFSLKLWGGLQCCVGVSERAKV